MGGIAHGRCVRFMEFTVYGFHGFTAYGLALVAICGQKGTSCRFSVGRGCAEPRRKKMPRLTHAACMQYIQSPVPTVFLDTIFMSSLSGLGFLLSGLERTTEPQSRQSRQSRHPTSVRGYCRDYSSPSSAIPSPPFRISHSGRESPGSRHQVTPRKPSFSVYPPIFFRARCSRLSP